MRGDSKLTAKFLREPEGVTVACDKTSSPHLSRCVDYIELGRRAADRRGGPPIRQIESRLQFKRAGCAGNLQRRDAVADPQQLQPGRGRELVQGLDVTHFVGPIRGQRVPRVRAAIAGDVNPFHITHVV